MSDDTIILTNDARKKLAIGLILNAPAGFMVKIGPATRSVEQNSMLWALLSDVARQIPWEVNGKIVYLLPEEWKDIFSASLQTEIKNAKGLDGNRVLLGARTSKMNKKEFGDLINLILSFGDQRGVVWSDEYAQAS